MLASLLAALVLTAPAPLADITFDHVLALPPLPGGARTPFRADPLVVQMSASGWHEPALGDTLGERQWKELKPDRDGLFEDRALAGGYALATFDAPDDAVMVLEAAGHVMVYVNPTPTSFELHTGDPYENGIARLPISVRKGHNALLFAAGRGHLRARLTAPPAPVFISPLDPTMPDLIQGAASDDHGSPSLLGAVVVVNATPEWKRGLTIVSSGPDAAGSTPCPVPPIPPLSVRKVPVTLKTQPQLAAGETTFTFAISEGAASTPSTPSHVPFKVRVRTPDQTRKVSFRSAIDGSVQYFGFNPPKMPESKPGISAIRALPALILSLHGASVEAAHQAECYAPKIWAALAAPTNRREYGFDWEDWGRLDALEVLDLFSAMTPHDPQRVYLTGHSMGGHGTWLIGSTYPDRFAAIAPSAGWTTFWSYGGAAHFDKDPTPIEKMFQRAMNPGDTIALAPTNLAEKGVYILHGDKDDNVPVEQARTMRELLKDHKDLAYHEQEGAGHWWGNECMDWPPLMDFLKGHELPKVGDVKHVQFTTANPAVSATCFWATIVQQEKQGELSMIDLTLDPKAGIRGTTRNVARLALSADVVMPVLGDSVEHGAQKPIEIDGVAVDTLEAPIRGSYHFVHTDTWHAAPVPALSTPDQKGPGRAGPFKHAFNHQPILVYGTGGDAAENAWMLAKARFDAETIWYRGNGCFDIVADTDFDPASFPDRSVILYGNQNINAAWLSLLKDSPLEVYKGGIFIGEHEFKDDWFAALFVRPRADAADALVGAVGFTGLRGARALERLPYFSSGVAYPDWTIFSSRVLTAGMGGVEGAGYFGNSWELDEAQSAWLVP